MENDADQCHWWICDVLVSKASKELFSSERFLIRRECWQVRVAAYYKAFRSRRFSTIEGLPAGDSSY